MLDINSVKLGFIGYGNMSGAVAAGLILSGAIKPGQIYACARDYGRLCERTAGKGINPVRTAEEAVECADVVFIGVKPYMLEEVMAPLTDKLAGKLVISMAANVFDEELERIMPGTHHLFTAPNTPVSVCEGIFILQKENSLSEEERSFTEKLLGNIALVMWMDREHIGPGGVISGCAPAFTAMYMEALGDAACRYGLTRREAYAIIAQMLAGTGKMALASGEHPGQMKDAVCSPGGITVIGVNALEKNGFRGAVIDAVDQIEKHLKENS